MKHNKILVTGASGYIGGKLIEHLGHMDYKVRCLVRNPEGFNIQETQGIEVVQADVLDRESLQGKLDDIDIAYYLVHSLDSGPDYGVKDQLGAENFGSAAKECGVRKIVYLGGLGKHSDKLSSHLRSRQETGEILRKSGVFVVEFRASVVLGKGSLSYEMMRHLVERLPFMVTPKWVSTPCQPIFIDDVISYLVEAIDLNLDANRIYEIGGPDVVSYGEMMREYAEHLGLKRIMIPVPVLTPYLSGLWLRLVTPEQAIIGRSLIEGLSNETIVNDKKADFDFSVPKTPISDAIRLSIEESG